MVINVTKDQITKRRAVVSDYAWMAPPKLSTTMALAAPKYRTDSGQGDPYAQLDPTALSDHVIDPALYEAR